MRMPCGTWRDEETAATCRADCLPSADQERTSLCEGLDRRLRLIAKAESRIVHGEFAEMSRFYDSIRKDGRYFLTAAVIALFGAVGSDDPVLFDAVLKDIAAFPARVLSGAVPEARTYL